MDLIEERERDDIGDRDNEGEREGVGEREDEEAEDGGKDEEERGRSWATRIGSTLPRGFLGLFNVVLFDSASRFCMF